MPQIRLLIALALAVAAASASGSSPFSSEKRDLQTVQLQNMAIDQSVAVDDVVLRRVRRQSRRPACTQPKENAVTYHGVPESLIRIGKAERDWTYFDIGILPQTNASLHLGFSTFDQVATLLFKGVLLGQTQFFSLELFDGFPYLVYNFGVPPEDTVRIRLAEDRVSDGEDHEFTMQITRRDRSAVDVLITFDANEIELLDQPTSVSWDGYLYLGGIDSPSRYTWKTWARRPLQGAINYLRLNGQYPDYSCFLATHSHSGLSVGVKNVTDYCADRSLCAQEDGGYCFNNDRPSYLCDCAHLPLTLDCRQNPLVMFFSNLYYEVGFSPLWTTHTDNLSISFNTSQSSPNALIFRIQNDDLKYYELRMVNGCLRFKVYVNRVGSQSLGEPIEFESEDVCSMNDNQWHVFKMQRRGEQVRLYIDGEMYINSTIPGYNFMMQTSLVQVGCKSSASVSHQCEDSSVFVGSLRNFIFNRVDILDIIRQGFQNREVVFIPDGSSTQITVTVIENTYSKIPDVNINIDTPDIAKQWPPSSEVTLTGKFVNIIEIPRGQNVMPSTDVASFNISFWFRTRMPNTLLLFMHPDRPSFREYVAVEIINSQVRVKFQYVLLGSTESTTVMDVFTFSGKNVSDNQFHYFSANFVPQSVTLTLDQQQQTIRPRQSGDRRLSSDVFSLGYVLLGGLPNAAWQHAFTNGYLTTPPNNFFAGCMAGLNVGQTAVDALLLNKYYVQATRPFVAISQCDSLGPSCADLMCQNFGTCEVDQSAANANTYRCNCSETSYSGLRCTELPKWGRYSARYGAKPGLFVVNRFPNVCPEGAEVLSIGFKSNLPRGTIFRLQREDAPENFLAAELREGGQLFIVFNNQEFRTVFQKGDDDHYHVLRLTRDGRGIRVYVDNVLVLVDPINVGNALPCRSYYQVMVGGSGLTGGVINSPFSGIVAGFSWNGVNILEWAETRSSQVTVHGDTVKHNLTLYPSRCPNIYNYLCAITTLAPLLPGAGAGVLTGDVQAVVGGGQIVNTLSIGTIQAFAILAGLILFLSALLWACYMCKPGWCWCIGPPQGSTVKVQAPLITSDGTQTDMNGLSVKVDDQTPLVEEEVPVAAAPKAFAGRPPLPPDPVESPVLPARRQGPEAPPAADRPDLEASRYYGRQMSSAATLNDVTTTEYSRQQFNFNTYTPTQMRFGSVPRYQPSASDFAMNRMGSSANQQFSSYQIDRVGMNEDTVFSTGASASAFNTLQQQNSQPGPFMIPDEFKVNCFVITEDSNAVLTGSAIGAPHKWDLRQGELVRAFEGQEDQMICAHEIHLACNDTILVGQISMSSSASDSSLPPNIRRLQVWDVETGKPLEMPYIVYCTATCLINSKQHLCAGAVENGGRQVSVLLWNLMANELVRQIKYPLTETSGLACADIQVHSILASPPDDRYLVVCLSRDSSPLTSFLVLDLYNASQYDAYTSTVSITFDSHPEAVVLKSNYEAVIGTRQGELIVWNLPSVKPLRQIWSTVGQVAHSQAIRSLGISHDMLYMASGAGVDGPSVVHSSEEEPTPCQAKVWRLDNEKQLHVLEGHTSDVTCCTFSVDNEVVITGSRDGSIRLFRIRDGTQMCWFTSNIEILQVRMSNDKRAIVALGDKQNHRKLIMLQIIRNKTRRTRPIQQEHSSTIQQNV